MSAESRPAGGFEILLAEMGRARAFYEHVPGLRIEFHDVGPLKMARSPMKNGEDGATGSLVRGGPCAPSHGDTLLRLAVPDIDVALKQLTERGDQVLNPRRASASTALSVTSKTAKAIGWLFMAGAH
jgi:predicted enzyme related to lactoylglutathione lyase